MYRWKFVRDNTVDNELHLLDIVPPFQSAPERRQFDIEAHA